MKKKKKKQLSQNEDSKSKARAFRLNTTQKYYLQLILTKENDVKLTIYRTSASKKDFIGMDEIVQ